MQPDDMIMAEIFIKDIGTTSNHTSKLHLVFMIRLTCYFVSSIYSKIKLCIIGTEQKIRMQYFQE